MSCRGSLIGCSSCLSYLRRKCLWLAETWLLVVIVGSSLVIDQVR